MCIGKVDVLGKIGCLAMHDIPSNELFIRGLKYVYNDLFVTESLLAEKCLVHVCVEMKNKKTANFADGLGFVSCYKGNINSDMICDVHRRVMYNLLPSAGVFRSVNVKPHQSAFEYMNYRAVSTRLRELCEKTTVLLATSSEPLLICMDFFADFLHIHPFVNGNGRVARLLLAFLMLKFGPIPVIIFADDQYIPCLEEAHIGSRERLQRFLLDSFYRSYSLACYLLDLS